MPPGIWQRHSAPWMDPRDARARRASVQWRLDARAGGITRGRGWGCACAEGGHGWSCEGLGKPGGGRICPVGTSRGRYLLPCRGLSGRRWLSVRRELHGWFQSLGSTTTSSQFPHL